MRVLVLMGGDSPEHDISIRSAQSVIAGLEKLGVEYVTYDPIDGSDEILRLARNCDVILPILHGINGEDGVVQELLESAGLKFLGADSKTSKVTIDKVATHEALRKNNILMPRYKVVTRDSFVSSELSNKPFVLKPIKGGSSIDTVIARADMANARETAIEKLQKYKYMLLEELIEGTELSAPVLGETALPLIQIIPPVGEEFDYTNKYNGKSQEICPVPHSSVSETTQRKVQEVVLKAHKILGVKHLSRSEFIVDRKGNIYMLELNTMPGLTDASLYPKSAKIAGYTMPQLVQEFVTMALGEK